MAENLGLPITFGMGETWEGSFSELLAEATAIITTSVAEGFGLAFLEPWLAHKPVCGRLLPEITTDFNSCGVDLTNCYERLAVPIDWIDSEGLRHRLRNALLRSYAAYGHSVSTGLFEMAWAALIGSDGCVDFGKLDETAQEEVLMHIHRNPECAKLLVPTELTIADESIIQKNYDTISANYDRSAYGERLAGLYRTVCQATPGPVRNLDGDDMLNAYLSPQRFNLLRT